MRLLAIILLSLALAPNASALRCGSDLVKKGDHISQVLDKCGEPDYEEKWVEEQIIHRKPHRLLPPEQIIGAVVVTLWTYNFGTREFMRQLRFENGRLVDIDTLDYGY